jgi:hypothetical protein
MSWSRVGLVAVACLGLTAAVAQQREALSTTCNASNRGTVNCPTYSAPAATAVPSASMDGSMMVTAMTSTTLFKGSVPPNAFVVQTQNLCIVNDNGPANGGSLLGGSGNPAGFLVVFASPGGAPFTYMTPPGYKPIGPVSIWCEGGGPSYVAARGW